MKNKLVGLTVAKLAKEKNFSNGTSDVFIEFSDKSVQEDVNNYTVNNSLACDMSSEYFTFFERPTQSLLQRWLREIHNIDIFVVASFIGEDKHKYSYYIVDTDNLDTDSDGSETVTYEEALEIALEEALTLVK